MDAKKQQLCLNCGTACERPNSETFHCPSCTQGLSPHAKSEQRMRWVKADRGDWPTSVACAQQVGDPWPEGFPEHLPLR